MRCHFDQWDRKAEIIDLYRQVFAASEGTSEGDALASLVTDLFAKTPKEDLRFVTADSDTGLQGVIMFTPLRYSDDNRAVSLLSPVAVRTDVQGRGVGQALIKYGLEAMKSGGTDVVLTYGDSNYYTRVGFYQIGQEQAPSPQKLSFPHGWMWNTFGDDACAPLVGTCISVAAFDAPEYW